MRRHLCSQGEKWNVELESCVYSFIDIPRPKFQFFRLSWLQKRLVMHLNSQFTGACHFRLLSKPQISKIIGAHSVCLCFLRHISKSRSSLSLLHIPIPIYRFLPNHSNRRSNCHQHNSQDQTRKLYTASTMGLFSCP